METNEVQWYPPEQASVAAPDTQTADDNHLPGLDGVEKGEPGYQEDEDNNVAKGDFKFYLSGELAKDPSTLILMNLKMDEFITLFCHGSGKLANWLAQLIECQTTAQDVSAFEPQTRPTLRVLK